mgnify:CR=1 FL=1
MKQPDTAALRERLANYTPEEEQRQDREELEGLLREVKEQTAEMRSLLKEIYAVKDELYDIHGSLKHTAVRERAAFRTQETAKKTADGILAGFSKAMAELQEKTVGVRVHPDSMKALTEVCNDFVVELGKQLLRHRDKQLELQKAYEKRIARMLERSKGVWLSDRWMKVLTACLFIYIAVTLIYML